MAFEHRGTTRLARFVLRHRLIVCLAWIAFVVVAGVISAGLPGVLQGGADPIPGSESDRVTRSIERAFGRGSYFQAPIVIHASGIPVDDPRWAGAMSGVERALVATQRVRRVRTFWNSGARELLGRDQHSALAIVTPDVRNFSEAEVLTKDLRDALRPALPEGFTAEVTGTVAMLYDLDQSSSSDLLKAERIGLPLTLIILLIVFQAPLAALLPLVLALGSVTVCYAVLFLLSRWMPVSVFAENTVSMIGLGVGVDYALFMLSRFRREIAAGHDAATAAERTVTAVGGAVMFSGATVAVGFLALFLVRAPFLHAVAIGGVCVVGTAVATSLTLLPALLSRFGRAFLWPARPRPARAAAGGAWSRWAHLVMARPVVFLIAGLAVMAALVAPVFGLRSWNIDARSLQPEAEARRGFESLGANFTVGWMGPEVLLFEAAPGTSVWSPRARAAILATAERLGRDPQLDAVQGFSSVAAALRPLGDAPIDPATLPAPLRAAASEVASADGRTAVVALYPRLDPPSRAAAEHAQALRREGWPEARGAGLTVHVGGPAAAFVDFDEELFGSLPRVIVAVLVLTFVVLMMLFRSLVIPLKATVLNLLSVLAAYGFLVLVFQQGVGAGLIGLVPPGGLNSFVVLMLFTILFGLSMDYEVFLLSRIREVYAATGDTRGAVATGLEETAGTITSAALIMVSIFAAFAFTRLTATREFGLGLAFAVALDATLVRVVLVPALMVLAGPLNWWLPAWLGGSSRAGSAAARDSAHAAAPAP